MWGLWVVSFFKWFHVGFCLIFVICSSVGYGVEVEGLYRASIAVKDQSSDEKTRVFYEATMEVLTKVTGCDSVNKSLTKDQVSALSSSLISSYNYSKLDELSENAEYLLNIKFNKQAVNKFLKKQNLPIWGGNRAQTLVWVVVESGQDRKILQFNQTIDVYDELEVSSKKMGVPLLYPVMDFQDIQSLQVADLWGLHSSPIQDASRRYGINSILAVKLFKLPSGRYNARILYFLRNKLINKDFQDIQASELVSNIFSILSASLVDFYGITFNLDVSDYLVIQVGGIESFASYAKTLKGLADLSIVQNVELQKIEGSKILLKLSYKGSREQVVAELQLYDKLHEVYAPPTSKYQEKESSIDLHFSLKY